MKTGADQGHIKSRKSSFKEDFKFHSDIFCKGLTYFHKMMHIITGLPRHMGNREFGHLISQTAKTLGFWSKLLKTGFYTGNLPAA